MDAVLSPSNAHRSNPLFTNIILHELGHNWERSLRRTQPELYKEVLSLNQCSYAHPAAE